MQHSIKKVAVIGAGTMGAGIAGVCAMANLEVLLLDLDKAFAEKALERLTAGRRPAVSEEMIGNITPLSIEEGIAQLADCDWICEVIIEQLQAKRDLFEKIENVRKDGSIITSNTSGIPLRDITAGMPERLRRDIAVTHFFNPVHIMHLLELVPGEETDQEVIDALVAFMGQTLKKGVVYAKDTVNFIGNRIGCFWILAGLHKAREAMDNGISMEMVDAVMSEPVGLPATGLYGLVDLIGLDIMDSVGKNLAENLPAGDAGEAFTQFPATEQAMLEAGQLGRKTGGGFYKLIRHEDGSKSKEVYDVVTQAWRAESPVQLDADHQTFKSLMFADTPAGQFSWDLMGTTLCYAADLVPEISDDIVNVDRAMRWGFSWAKGPFELLDELGATAVIEKLEANGQAIPAMLRILKEAGVDSFYRNDGQEYLGVDGQYHATPAE